MMKMLRPWVWTPPNGLWVERYKLSDPQSSNTSSHNVILKATTQEQFKYKQILLSLDFSEDYFIHHLGWIRLKKRILGGNCGGSWGWMQSRATFDLARHLGWRINMLSQLSKDHYNDNDDKYKSKTWISIGIVTCLVSAMSRTRVRLTASAFSPTFWWQRIWWRRQGWSSWWWWLWWFWWSSSRLSMVGLP